jgi:[acyl-carrier-protein] S-malonyltransferase
VSTEVTFAVLFPGQGAQTVGMGADVFAARSDLLGESADRVLGWSLQSLCLDGPDAELTRTDKAQPALYAVAYALWDELRRRLRRAPQAFAGHSLGEYTALAAAGVLSFGDGLHLVAERGKAMADAANVEPSGMSALIGAGGEAAEDLAAACRRSGGRVWVANVNAPGQVVVAGAAQDLAWVEEHASEYGVRRVVALKVAGAFHTPLMAPAATRLRGAVSGIRFREPGTPVWANVNAAPYGGDPGETLVAQLTSPVLFGETLAGMGREGIGTFIHVGPGEVTAGLARRSVEGAETHVVSTLDQAIAVAEALNASW